MANHGAEVEPRAFPKSPAAPWSDEPGHRQRGPPCWHSGGRESPLRKCLPLPEWRRCSLPGSLAEERAGGLRCEAVRVSVGPVCSAWFPLALASFRNVLNVTIIIQRRTIVKGKVTHVPGMLC